MSNEPLSQWQVTDIQLTDKLTPLITVLRNKNIANIKPKDFEEDEVILISLDADESNIIFNTSKLFPKYSSKLLDYPYEKTDENNEYIKFLYNRIYTIINDELRLDGLKIIEVKRWNSSNLSIRIKKTTGGSGGKKKRSIKRRKSTKKNRHIKRNRHTKRR
jgi:hypothetical protein